MRICVYCSSSDAVDIVYKSAAAEFGQQLADHGHQLVYGGGSIGLMGIVARAVSERSGKVIGIIPEALNTVEIAYQSADELIVAADMRERKALMDQKSDAFVALPGGFGTLDEVAEMITQKQLGYHQRPVVFLNTAGFFSSLLNFFEDLYQTKFAKPDYRSHYAIMDEPSGLFDYLDNYQPPDSVRKWY